MEIHECRRGMKVIFGRNQGEKTLAEVVKVNSAKAVLRTLENRGSGRGSAAGAEWRVPYSMFRPATPQEISEGEANQQVLPPTAKAEPLKYSEFQPAADQHILNAILDCYCSLSPENLYCDGEVSASAAKWRRSQIMQKLEGLFLALGRRVSEDEAYNWDRQRRASKTPA